MAISKKTLLSRSARNAQGTSTAAPTGLTREQAPAAQQGLKRAQPMPSRQIVQGPGMGREFRADALASPQRTQTQAMLGGMTQQQQHEANRKPRTQQQMMAKGGVVKAACGASVPPAQKRK